MSQPRGETRKVRTTVQPDVEIEVSAEEYDTLKSQGLLASDKPEGKTVVTEESN